MREETLKNLLMHVAEGDISPADAVEQIKTLPYEDLDYAKIDHHRELRTGYPEVVFCLGKTESQVAGIMARLSDRADLIMGTKASGEQFNAVRELIPEARYYEVPRIIAVGQSKAVSDDKPIKKVAIVTAGTADMPIAEEAAVTAELYGEKVDRFYDVGVAGIHRLTENLPKIREANVIIVVAGMEGALASVLGGLVDKPVIAVPTSVGYGANLGGLTALLAMLNSCSLGVSVMNIDNGFGAGHLASIINRL
jgi:NCAIR mutase (PurE)-related protein